MNQRPPRFPTALNASAIMAVGIGLLMFLLSPPPQQTIVARTISLGFSASAIAFALACPAYFSIRANTTVGKTLFWVSACLAVLPPYLIVGCWDAAFGKLGWLTSTESTVLVPLLSGWPAAIWVHALAMLPQFILIICFAYGRGEIWEEQASLEASSWQLLWHVNVKRLLPTAILCCAWGVIVCSREIGVTDLYQIGTLAEQVYLGYSLGQMGGPAGNWSPEQLQFASSANISASVYASVICIMMGIALFATAKLFQHLHQNGQTEKRAFSNHSVVSPAWSIFSLWAGGVLVLLCVVPVFNVVYRVGLAVETLPDGFTQVWRFENVVDAIAKTVRDHRAAFFWSSLIGLCSASLLVIVAGIACWFARTNKIVSFVLLLSFAALSAVSGPAIGSTITDFLSTTTLPPAIFWHWLYDRTLAPAIIANALFVWPIAVIGLWTLTMQIPNEQLEQAELERIGPLTRLLEFGFRQNWRGLIGIGLLLFSISFCELSATQMVLPPGIETVPQITLGKLHAGVDEATAALTILTLFLISAIALIGWGLNHRQFHFHHRQ